jgi:hypothetical protein
MLRLYLSIFGWGYCSVLTCDDFPEDTATTQDQTLKLQLLTCLMLSMYVFTKMLVDNT